MSISLKYMRLIYIARCFSPFSDTKLMRSLKLIREHIVGAGDECEKEIFWQLKIWVEAGMLVNTSCEATETI